LKPVKLLPLNNVLTFRLFGKAKLDVKGDTLAEPAEMIQSAITPRTEVQCFEWFSCLLTEVPLPKVVSIGYKVAEDRTTVIIHLDEM
jgi:hypothetical protein